MEQVFTDCYDAESNGIFRFCYFKTGDRSIALDLTQDTFTKVWSYLQNGEEIGNIRAFVYRVARNTIIDHYRKKKSVSLDSITEKGIDYSKNDHTIMEDNAEISQILIQVEKLEKDYRDVLFLKITEDLSPSQIAKILNENENAISVRIHRGLEKLRNIMQGEL